MSNKVPEKGPRMPVMLPDELEDKWLIEVKDELDIKELEELLKPYPESEMQAHTVGKLRGKYAVGNPVDSLRGE